MRIGIPKISIRKIFDTRFLASLFVVVMCIQFVPLEGYGISPIKVGLMGFSVLIFFLIPLFFQKSPDFLQVLQTIITDSYFHLRACLL